MAKKSVGGRPVLYGPKTQEIQVRNITATGRRILNTARTVVQKLSKWSTVTDADVTEYLARAWYAGREAADAEIAKKNSPRESK